MNVHKHAPLIVTMGDPAGCAPQITAAAWTSLRANKRMTFAVAGPADLYASNCAVQPISSLTEAHDVFPTALPVLDCGLEPGEVKPGDSNKTAGLAILSSIEKSVEFVLSGEASALVTNPINKALLYSTGFKHPGHTEYLSALCAKTGERADKPVMMLVGGGLRVALATIHMPLVEAAQSLTQRALVKTAEIVAKGLQQDFGLTKPRIAFAGLNPHAGENGTIGREEIDIINPAADTLRKTGIDISDARSADTVFAEALNGKFDAVIAMTHDQGLIPVKTLDFWGGVNTTLGLPIIRTSPDHGTAYEAAKEGTCRPDSLIAAIMLAAENAANRARVQSQDTPRADTT